MKKATYLVTNKSRSPITFSGRNGFFIPANCTDEVLVLPNNPSTRKRISNLKTKFPLLKFTLQVQEDESPKTSKEDINTEKADIADAKAKGESVKNTEDTTVIEPSAETGALQSSAPETDPEMGAVETSDEAASTEADMVTDTAIGTVMVSLEAFTEACTAKTSTKKGDYIVTFNGVDYTVTASKKDAAIALAYDIYLGN